MLLYILTCFHIFRKLGNHGMHQVIPPRGTQKGDVYAFGIILYEIFGRTVDPVNGPYGETIYSHSEIVRLVAAGGTTDQTDGCFATQGSICEKYSFYQLMSNYF